MLTMLLLDLHHPAMRERHWLQLMKVCALACCVADSYASATHRADLSCLYLFRVTGATTL